ncbi:MAG TPA: hypothetical protein VHG72_13985 [Polyangia bacterium]|nr:hypothetical protein [Polyangia bacterium]
MNVRSFPPDKLCDDCLARITAMKTDDELNLLKELCADCEGMVAAAGRPEGAIGWESGSVVDFEGGEEILRMKPRWLIRKGD